LAAYIQLGKDKSEAWRLHSKGIDLREHDLRGADFSYSDFYGADLQGANLDFAILAHTETYRIGDSACGFQAKPGRFKQAVLTSPILDKSITTESLHDPNSDRLSSPD
jgi:uncharacterized protein YjbI with pentapeptide repeats